VSSVGRIWEALANRSNASETAEGWTFRRLQLDSACAVLGALRQPEGTPAILIEVNTRALGNVVEYPSAKGFEVYPEPVTLGPRGRARLCLVLADENYREVFEVLANDVAERLSSTSEEPVAIRALLARLNVWQAFMRKHSGTSLAREEQVGLFGELLFLSEHLLKFLEPSDAIDAWKGPFGGTQDFDLRGRCVEVKTTTQQPPISVKINSLAQLDETLVEILFLWCVSLASDKVNGESLPDLVERLRTSIKSEDASAGEKFDASLMVAGYFDAHSKGYDDFRYSIRKTTFFQVEGEFPRIKTSDLRDGIAECNYSLILAECAKFKLSSTEALKLISNQEQKIGS